MSSFQASSSTATAVVDDSVPPDDDVDLCFESNDPDDSEDEVSSTSSLSASPTRYVKFEPVPYQDDLEKIQKLGDCVCDDDLYKLTGFKLGEVPIRAGPVLQVFSVTISNEYYYPWEDFEIFGEISITDRQNNTFYIYNCKEDKPDLVSTECDRLTLKGWPITPVYTGEKLKFSLTNKKSGKIFFEGEYDVDFSTKDAYASKDIIKCSGKDGFYASMEYIKIPLALVAMVSIYIEDTFEGRGGCFDIHGTIKVNDLVLFEKQSSEPVNMKHGLQNPFMKSTCVLAVPVHSKLAAEVELYSGDDLVTYDKIKVWPMQPEINSQYRICKDGSYGILMCATWDLHEDYFDRYSQRWVDNMNVKWDSTCLPAVQLDPPSDELSKQALVEVFSVFVGGKSSAPLDLCGEIVVRGLDRNNTVFIFARNSEIPDGLTDKQWRTVSLAWSDCWFVERDFCMYLNLKDKYGKRVCRGLLWWHKDENALEGRYDRRLCVVIPGANGYFAAVHYSVFKNGKKAKVTLTWKSCSTFIYGSIYAAYSNDKYPSTYDNKYYKSIIFKRSVNDIVSVEKDSDIPLSKSHVSAPSYCKGLCVHFNLYNGEPYRADRSFVKGRYSHMFEFKADEKKVVSNRWFSVKVEWPSNSSE